MEIKAELIKPYTEEQRLDFIINQNYNNGFEIKKTETSLQAWGYTAEELEKQNKERIALLNMTKLDFVNALESFGVNYYEHIVPLLESNLEAKKQWDLCERVYRFNPLLDELAKGFGITPNQLDKIFGGQ
jgi:hypothetical protein